MTQSCMSWGFDCGDGWFLIVWQLSEQLEKLGCVAAQVKEKFGLLRFYLESYPDGAQELIAAAERLSSVTCDKCGQPGTESESGWMRIRCDMHKA